MVILKIARMAGFSPDTFENDYFGLDDSYFLFYHKQI